MINTTNELKSELSIRERAEAQITANINQVSESVQELSLEKTRDIMHEFEVHQIELEMQNEELQITYDELKAIKKRYFDLYDMAPIGYCTLTQNGLIEEVNFSIATLFGKNRKKLIKQPITNFIFEKDQDIYYLFNKKLFETKEQQECELRIFKDDKMPIWVYMSAKVENDVSRLVIKDISARKKSEEKLELLASVFKSAGEAIMITDTDGIIKDVNFAFCTTTGYSKEDVVGKKTNILNSGKQDKQYYKIMWETLKETGSWNGEIWNKRKNGEIFAELLMINTVFDEQGNANYFIALFSDITNIKNYEKSLENMANYDQLTKLPNRVLLADRLLNNIAQTKRNKKNLAVIFLDLDGFKEVNDSYGHFIGDKLLIALAKIMKEALREGDTLSRIGGDEFVAVLIDLDDISSALPIINRLCEIASKTIEIEKHSIQVSASLGVTFYPQEETVSADQLLRQADQAMYQAKVSGKNRFHVFDTKEHQFITERYEGIELLSHALEKKEFVLYYQPKINMHTGDIIGSEALIRWQHPSKGIIPPLEFLPILEGHTLAIEVGKWVLETAILQLEIWQKDEIQVPISVNISAQHLLNNGFVSYLSNLFTKYPTVNPNMLEIEVLESSKLEDLERAIDIMNNCIKLGVTFSLDDFGTGYSSLTYLKRLPVKYIKIDQSFVRDMLHDSNDLGILEGIISLAKAFRYKVIAEGVETSEHALALLGIGCNIGQGYAISHPLPIVEFNTWIENYNHNEKWKNQGLMDEKQRKTTFSDS